jgi:hypothetical protein
MFAESELICNNSGVMKHADAIVAVGSALYAEVILLHLTSFLLKLWGIVVGWLEV